MDFLKNTAICLIAAAAAGTLATIIVPRGSMDKTLRAVAGIFVVAVICSPIAEISESHEKNGLFPEISENMFCEEYVGDMREQMLEVFDSAVASCVNETADELNVKVVSVISEMDADENNCINIHKIVVRTGECEADLKEYLSAKISENLGVPAEIIAE